MQKGNFRADLYYRINVVKIELPSLRQRGGDLLEIAEYLLEKAAMRHNKPGLHLLPEAVEAINSYSWPGNVRELENIIERAAIMSDHAAIDPATLEIDIEHLNSMMPITRGSALTSYADLYQPSQQSHSTNRDSRPDPNEDLSQDSFQRAWKTKMEWKPEWPKSWALAENAFGNVGNALPFEKED